MSALDILIPCKSLRRGKSRLAPAMSAFERQALCRRFFDRTLSLAMQIGERVAVVSDDMDVRSLAERSGAMAIEDPGKGLNAALHFGNTVLLSSGAANSLLVLPIDIPLATLPALHRVFACSAEVVIAPDRHGTGTNLLLLDARAREGFRFAYGLDSFHHHELEAGRLGLRVAIVREPRLTWDVDEPGDLRHSGLIRRTVGGSALAV